MIFCVFLLALALALSRHRRSVGIIDWLRVFPARERMKYSYSSHSLIGRNRESLRWRKRVAESVSKTHQGRRRHPNSIKFTLNFPLDELC